MCVILWQHVAMSYPTRSGSSFDCISRMLSSRLTRSTTSPSSSRLFQYEPAKRPRSCFPHRNPSRPAAVSKQLQTDRARPRDDIHLLGFGSLIRTVMIRKSQPFALGRQSSFTSWCTKPIASSTTQSSRTKQWHPTQQCEKSISTPFTPLQKEISTH